MKLIKLLAIGLFSVALMTACESKPAEEGGDTSAEAVAEEAAEGAEEAAEEAEEAVEGAAEDVEEAAEDVAEGAEEAVEGEGEPETPPASQ